MKPGYQVGLTVVIVAVAGAVPRVVTVGSGFVPPAPVAGLVGRLAACDQLPGAPFEPARWRTLQEAVRAVAGTLSGLGLRYVEQLYTFGDRHRDPHELFGGPRSLVVSYLALVRDGPLDGARGANWLCLYEYFPWEDWRDQRPAVIDQVIRPGLDRWADRDGAQQSRRRERVQLAFGLDGGNWDAERVLDRYELLYEAGLVAEAAIDRALQGGGGSEELAPLPALGRPMVRDGRRILATALERLRGKLKYRPIVFELLPPAFTLHQVQQVVEALSGTRLHKQNFRRLIISDGLVEATGQFASQTLGRPAELYRFRRQAMLERTSTGGSVPAPDPANL